MKTEPVTLERRVVRLDPLTRAHHHRLCEVGLDEELWKWIPVPVRTADEMAAYLEKALDEQQRGVSLPFAIVERASELVIGSTRYMNIEREHRRVEIGCTWVAQAWQRSPVNTEAKYLLLRHAFDTLGCMRVELKTDSLNEKSRAAIQRIGAKEEGIFRNHMITASGRIRHTVYYSIVEAEWPGIRARLEQKMAAQSGIASSENGDPSRSEKPAA
ncbi:MAG TPA: GNAT family protein [Candidatus Dormibacteraeota bacterium]|nr:GNAT family protein [Candidatus Dormibacteraeota bacterium]